MITEKMIVLRVFKHGESDLIVHALNMSGQKQSVFARAALKSKKRFGGGVLEPTHFIQATYQPARGEGGLGSLREAQLIEEFSKIRNDYDKVELALHFIDLIDRMSFEGTVDSEGLFDLLGNALRAVETVENLERLRVHFELKLLAIQGMLPHIQGAETLLERPLKENNDIALSADDLKNLSRAVYDTLRNA